MGIPAMKESIWEAAAARREFDEWKAGVDQRLGALEADVAAAQAQALNAQATANAACAELEAKLEELILISAGEVSSVI
jgi:hypothetical protein